MKRFAIAAALFFAAPSVRAEDPKHIPEDFRMSIRVGGGYTWLVESPAFALGLEYGFTGGKSSDTVRFEWGLGISFIAGTTKPIVLPNDKGEIVTWDFPRDSLMVVWGPGVRFGQGDSFMLSIRAFVGPVLSSRPGPIKDDAITTVGAGFGGTLEIFPFYMDLGDRARRGDKPSIGEWLGSSVSVWTMGRMEWVGVERGPSLTFGLGIDMLRAIVGPIVGKR